MTIGACLSALAPEFVLLVGACLVLIVGVRTRRDESPHLASGLTLLVVVLALVLAVTTDLPADGLLVPGLWLTSLTVYVRWVTLAVGLAFVLVNWRQPAAAERGEYHALLLLALLGVLLTASANDMVVLLLALELVSVPTYALVALSRPTQRAAEAAVKYFFLGALAAALMAYGFSFLYGAAGTTRLFERTASGEVAAVLGQAGVLGAYGLIGLLLVVGGLAFKVAAVPFHVYAPDVYEGAAAPLTGVLGFVPKMAGFVALVKLLSACGWSVPAPVLWALWALAAATMTAGNVLALLQTSVKRLLAYSSIAHSGYLLIAVLVGPVVGEGPLRDGVAAMLFYLAIYGLMNLGVFAVLATYRGAEGELETLDDLAGLSQRAPVVALGLAVCVLSLMGFPPMAGLWGKVFIFSSAFSVDAEHAFRVPIVVLAVIGVVNSAVAVAYYLRVLAAAYVRESQTPRVAVGGMPIRWGLVLCAVPMLIAFAWPNGVARRAVQATASLRPVVAAGRARTATAPAATEAGDVLARQVDEAGLAESPHS